MTHLSLFSGIGGLDLAAESAGFKTVGQCEWADYPTKILEKHWPDVPRWRDIKTLTGTSFYEKTGLHTVDVISGGFPCQPFSNAGKRRGVDDDRYLWPEMLRVIRELNPRWVVGKNVAGIVNMTLDTVLFDLENEGYETRAFIIPACGVNAPHRRERCAIIGFRDRKVEKRNRGRGRTAETLENPDSVRRGKPEILPQQPGGTEFERHGEAMADTSGERQQRGKQYRALNAGRAQEPYGSTGKCSQVISDTYNRHGLMWGNREFSAAASLEGTGDDYRGRTKEHGQRERRPTEPRMGRSVDGFSAWMDEVRTGWATGNWEQGIPRIAGKIPDRVNRLKCLGNAVVPAQFYPIFRAIVEIERSMINEQKQ